MHLSKRNLILQVCAAEAIPHDDSGLEALLFTAEGDMRNALNNLQSTFAGFGKQVVARHTTPEDVIHSNVGCRFCFC
jgi:DNA polymerase III delta prime subunit